MTVEMPTCYGCCLNPGFPSPFYTPPFQMSQFVDLLGEVKLTPEERELLKRLGEAYGLYCNLDKKSEADNKEFVDAIHRLQQLVALRVARRVDIDVWAQPE